MAKLTLGCASLALVTALGHWGCSFEVDEIPLGPTLTEFNVEGPHELVGAAQRALARINRASCLGLSMPRTRGIPVQFGAMRTDGACAETNVSSMAGSHVVSVDIGVKRVAPGDGCADLETQVLHEVIHALRAEYNVPRGEEPDDHAKSALSVYYPRAQTGAILDSEALLAICEFQPCSCFNPETP